MKHIHMHRIVTTIASAGLVGMALAMPLAAFAQANPCAAGTGASRTANPCAANPCAAKNACAAKNPCAAKAIQRPAGYTPYQGNRAELVAAGEKLFSDASLSTNNSSCATCHSGYAGYKASFAQPYPHKVEMAKGRYGMDRIHLDEMVQLCIATPMAGKPLDWKSKELAALVAYAEEQQKGFKAHLAKNPCAAKK